MRYLTETHIAQAISVLQHHPRGKFGDALRELEQLWGAPVGKSKLAHAFKLRRLPTPTSYMRAETAADRCATLPRAGRVGTEPVGHAPSAGVRDSGKQEVDKGRVSVNTGVDDPRKDPTLHVPNAPNGYHLKGVSTMLDGDGNVAAQWVKTVVDRDSINLEYLLEAIKHLPDEFREAHQPKVCTTENNSDLLCVYPLGDVHLACYAWAEETGSNYDLKIAERIHTQAIKRLVSLAPPAKQALIISLGDFFHSDSNLARTERSGNPLDTDSRFALVLRVGVRLFRTLIDTALEKHEKVRAIVEIGNHDQYSSAMLALALDAFYARDERVTIDTSPARFHWHRFGQNLIGTTHGSDTKAEQLPMIMAHDRAVDWGACRHRRWYVGHIHQERVKEYPGCVIEWFRTLAGKDAWSSGMGYRSDRDMRVDVLHREHGFVTRHVVGIDQLEAA